MNYKSLILPILGATLAAGLVRYYFPKVETKTVTVTKTVIQRDVRTVTRIVERKDGSKETIIEHVDHSTEQKDKNKIAIKYKEPQWRIGLVATIATDGSSKATSPARYMPQYGMELQKRLVGPLYLGIQYVHPQAGISIGLEF